MVQLEYMMPIASGSIAEILITYAFHIHPIQEQIGMSDGAVHVIEPLDTEPKRGSLSSQDNGTLPTNPSSSALNSQPSETPPR
ncbi:unnamed protein product [Coffea canephora]|uniref:Uncharacterized protein n=1 Tax=Coffea canephora TaxID=49390 RepID=A0A068UVX1_COFCA|nr:unnamed protein product [Coffea canephora]